MFATAFVSNEYADEISFDVADEFPRTVPAFISAVALRFLQFFFSRNRISLLNKIVNNI